ncbi:glutathione S-transferase N-terminal domain-containing protein [Rugamonas sp. A1-17]|nr:glutathione S-transferase N-terminal domain-containing protein [Rugamonas sp. A1-17]
MTSLAKPVRPIRLYRSGLSGHAYSIELFLSLLFLPLEVIDGGLANGQQRTPEYPPKNPSGQVPAIDDSGFVLHDSNAIVAYLARTYGEGHWMPTDTASEAKIQHWLTVLGLSLDHVRTKAISKTLFDVLEPRFAACDFALGGQATVADVAAYTYVAHVPEGDIDMAPYPAIRGWLTRIETLPGFVPIQKQEQS